MILISLFNWRLSKPGFLAGCQRKTSSQNKEALLPGSSRLLLSLFFCKSYSIFFSKSKTPQLLAKQLSFSYSSIGILLFHTLLPNLFHVVENWFFMLSGILLSSTQQWLTWRLKKMASVYSICPSDWNLSALSSGLDSGESAGKLILSSKILKQPEFSFQARLCMLCLSNLCQIGERLERQK